MSLKDRLELMVTLFEPADWFLSSALITLAAIRDRPREWGRIKAQAQTRGVRIRDLEAAVDDMLQEIHALEAKHVQAGTATGTPRDTPLRTSPWAAAVTAEVFLAQDSLDPTAYVQDLVLPGAITLLAAPRASGKSLVALFVALALATAGTFRGTQLPRQRVLLLDRDNPPALVRKRLRWLGAQQVTGLKVLTRDNAPPLTDKAAWEAFPAGDYEVIIVDSIGASTEGVSEKEGRQTQEFLATLKNLAHRGPAILALDNTNKAATNYRGRGEKADAVDILYEARNITGWTPSHGGDWWASLPEFGEHAWQQRASRHKGQTVLRLAFIPSKFRLGVEPDPFVLEIDTRQDPWTLTDITEQIATLGEDTARAARDQTRRQLEQAAHALVAHLQARHPAINPLLKSEGVAFLQQHGLSQKQSRLALDDGFNKDVHPREGLWHLRFLARSRGRHAQVILLPQQLEHLHPVLSLVGEEESNQNNTHHTIPRKITPTEPTILVGGSLPSDQNTSSPMTSNGAIS